ncbi:PhzF family phenazine biosynthesis protein [Jeotgalibacillus sp. R-1-5s-1]|uniref:PhzF family phenazine biosynthesis protein n=1 Tax=Jeotgalibacillus sp. R-1-5s-1 TaxID=2555897 RepID=UPI00106BE47C|nr:PhzF family phenazine biosynthesis protein [Jeotgalibacillus sp. R-1-5s-1]TFE00162.1 PhzF family phenazine biosynthesis protein [Jeotgalibacillus sp. R-1-5s-1]
MKTLSYSLLDVFTTTPFGGNQLAVFYEELPLGDERMQQIARELNLSETVFVQPPSNEANHKRLRIFTPQMELPMAGHPTIGTAFLLADKGLIDVKEGENSWVLEEGVGDIPVTVTQKDGTITSVQMQQPVPQFGSVFDDRKLAAELLSLSQEDLSEDLPVQTVSSGVPFLFIPVRSLDAMKKIQFRMDVWEQHFSLNDETQHIFAFSTETEHATSHVHSRMFAPAMGIAEDPATGGASGPLGAYLVKNGLVQPAGDQHYMIISEQGLEMGRPSFIEIEVQTDAKQITQVKIGGPSIIVGAGELYIEE